MSLKDKLAGVKMPEIRRRTSPLWTGPAGEGPNGGVTQGLIGRWLSCPERFRLHAMEGLRAADSFSVRLEFGNMWHVCEEELARGGGEESVPGRGADWWVGALKGYSQSLCRRYPLQQDQVVHWYNVVKTQFPVYVGHWEKHQDVVERTPLLQEQPFDVPYPLPSGRVVRLRGKWDSVDLIGSGKGAGIYLQENKTKSQINVGQIQRQLSFDLQTMLYLVALGELQRMTRDGEAEDPLPDECLAPLLGVCYNVIRRDCPIRQHQPTKGVKCTKCKGVGYLETRLSGHLVGNCACLKCGGSGRTGGKPGETPESFYRRLADDYFKAEPDEWFMRWKVEVLPADVQRFRREFLDPVLETMLDDYEWWSWIYNDRRYNPFDFGTREARFQGHVRRHYRYPFGGYNVLTEGGASETDEYLNSGSEVGLTRTDVLFPELVS